MRIRRKFLQLTKWTYPYGTEHTLENYLPRGFRKDENENYYFQIGENPTTMFVCHLDTACEDQVKVTHVQNEQFITTNGKSILGADDKAGMTLILYMIEKKVPGLYYFFIGEEVGCIGSRELAEQWTELQMFNNIKKVISFDRKGTTSIITHQLYGRCCSDDFAKELANRLNSVGEGLQLMPDDTGIMTDSAQFTELVPECTNISVGYYNEHTHYESQNIEYLQRLCRAVVKIDWETLPVKRDPDDEEEDIFGCGWGNYSVNDHEYEFHESYYTHVKVGREIKKMLVSRERIKDEKVIINRWIKTVDSYVDIADISWNGNVLYVHTGTGRMEFVGTRTDLMEYIQELSTIPRKHLSDKPKKKEDCIEDTRSIREFLM